MKNAYLFLAEGFEDVEAITIVDLLRRADVCIKMVSVSDSLTVASTHGVKISADLLFDQASLLDADLYILPGGMPGTKNLDSHEGLKQLFIDAFGSGKLVAAICAAPMVFGRLGFLKGKRATCYPGFENELLGAAVTGANVEVDGTVITGKALGSAIEFSLGLISVLYGEEKAKEVANAVLFDFLPKKKQSD